MREKVFSNAKWIWIHGENKPDEYAEFIFEFNGERDVKYEFLLTGDSNYNVYLNEKLVGFGQPTDYPTYKIYDSFPFENVIVGKNTVRILVWYYGRDTQTYVKDDAGAIFELRKNGKTIYASREKTLGRLCTDYENYRNKNLTVQLGLGYKYLAGVKNDLPYEECVIREKNRNFHLRATERVILKDRVPVEIIRKENCWLIDMREETVGFLELDIESDKDDLITVAYGEYLMDDGNVLRYMSRDADFSVDIAVKKGRTVYTNAFRRFAGRYLQVFTEAELKINYIGLRPTEYPLTAKKAQFQSELRNRIYDTSVKTLLSCMHEHYEDCPWREQALYQIDSRNEMLCTYYAFNDYKFARANLVLMAQGQRLDGLFTICFPAGLDFPIPSFSMIYPVQIYEYIRYSGDESILRETFDAMQTAMNTFIQRIDKEKNLIADFPYPYWNFYEWSEGSSNEDQIFRTADIQYPKKYSLILNVEFLFVLDYYKKLCAIYGKPFEFDDGAMRRAIVDTFYVSEKGLFKATDVDEPYYTALGNSYAVLVGLGDKELAEKLISGDGLVPVTLSMSMYLYDALLKLDKNYKDFIVKDIDRKYKRMLDLGATTFWETEKGCEDQGHTGSLCHGWAAIPIYYYTLLNGEEYFNGTL
jgi:hypothetical protein